jgi:hypothetical protein
MTCTCTPCSECGGGGSVFISATGEYLGPHRRDDLDELETCPECNGSGVGEYCEECLMLMEMDEDE